MTGRAVVLGLLAAALLMGAGLWYAQTHAYYSRVEGVTAITVAGREAAVAGWRGIDADSSPLKLRGCFTIDPAALAHAPAAPGAAPLVAPYWFDCFDAAALGADLAAGRARAVVAGADGPVGFERVVAYYPDGRAYLWRRLREE